MGQDECECVKQDTVATEAPVRSAVTCGLSSFLMVLGTLLTLISLGAIGVRWVTQPPEPILPLIVKNNGADFGRVRWKDTKDLEFQVENPLKVPVAILDFKSSCGCTKPDTSAFPMKLMPGETGKLAAKYNTYNTVRGQDKRGLSILCQPEGQQAAWVGCEFSIWIEPDYWLDPPNILDFGEVSSSRPAAQTVNLKGQVIPHLKVAKVVAYPEAAMHVSVDYDAKSDSSTINVSLDPSKIPFDRRWTGKLTLYLDRPTRRDDPSLIIRAIRPKGGDVAATNVSESSQNGSIGGSKPPSGGR